MFAPEPTFAQHGEGGGHSGGHFNGGHFRDRHFEGGRGLHSARPLVGAGTHNSGIARLRGIVPPAHFSRPIVSSQFVAEDIFRPRRFPILPIFFGFPGFGFGGLFFGGFNSWGSACGPSWIRGFGCDILPYYGFGYSGYNLASQPNYSQTLPPPYDSESRREDSSEQTEIELYLNGGTVYGLRDYWFAGGRLHYITNYGGENAIDIDLVDLQKTVDENALRGVNLTLWPLPMPSNKGPNPSAASPLKALTHWAKPFWMRRYIQNHCHWSSQPTGIFVILFGNLRVVLPNIDGNKISGWEQNPDTKSQQKVKQNPSPRLKFGRRNALYILLPREFSLWPVTNSFGVGAA
jgi:hypothetical protein